MSLVLPFSQLGSPTHIEKVFNSEYFNSRSSCTINITCSVGPVVSHRVSVLIINSVFITSTPQKLLCSTQCSRAIIHLFLTTIREQEHKHKAPGWLTSILVGIYSEFVACGGVVYHNHCYESY
jgi:hypothetical protein